MKIIAKKIVKQASEEIIKFERLCTWGTSGYSFGVIKCKICCRDSSSVSVVLIHCSTYIDNPLWWVKHEGKRQKKQTHLMQLAENCWLWLFIALSLYTAHIQLPFFSSRISDFLKSRGDNDKQIHLFSRGRLLPSYFLKKTIKSSLIINMQTVHWQMNNPRERKVAYRTMCGVELAARPSKTSFYFLKDF